MIAIILIVFMEKDKPQGVLEFPLTEHTARLIINDLARNHHCQLLLQSGWYRECYVPLHRERACDCLS